MPTYVIFVLHVFGVEELQQSLLYERLLVEGTLVLDDLDGDPFLVHQVIRLHHLQTHPHTYAYTHTHTHTHRGHEYYA